MNALITPGLPNMMFAHKLDRWNRFKSFDFRQRIESKYVFYTSIDIRALADLHRKRQPRNMKSLHMDTCLSLMAT